MTWGCGEAKSGRLAFGLADRLACLTSVSEPYPVPLHDCPSVYFTYQCLPAADRLVDCSFVHLT